MYYLDEWGGHDYLLIEDPNHLEGARCEKCVPVSYEECFEYRTLTKKLCRITECNVKLCKECRVSMGRDNHDWHHVGFSKIKGASDGHSLNN